MRALLLSIGLMATGGWLLISSSCSAGRSLGLDTSFGSSGKVTTDFNSNEDDAYAVAIQSDGKIVVVGQVANTAGSFDFGVARYLSDGSLDTEFNSTGKATVDFGANDTPEALLLQNDGKLVLVGHTKVGSTTSIAMARLNANGSLDTDFNSTGKISYQIGSETDEAHGAALQPDGKYVIVGGTKRGSGTDVFILRIKTDGSRDTQFGSNGQTVTSIRTTDDEARAVVLDSNNKMLVVGHSKNGDSREFALLRYGTDGALDTSFDSVGYITANFGGESSPPTPSSASDDVGRFAHVNSDGTILIGGTTRRSSLDSLALLRFSSKAALDGSFGASGKVATNFKSSDGTQAHSQGNGLAVLDGSIILVGATTLKSGVDFAIAKYDRRGSLDSTFGTQGLATLDFGSGADEAYAATVQSDSKLVVVGRAFNGSHYDFALARYHL